MRKISVIRTRTPSAGKANMSIKDEKPMLEQLNNSLFQSMPLSRSKDQFAHNDFYNDKYIIEYKTRNIPSTRYNDCFFENYKFEKNISDKRDFLYLVKFTDKTVIWNISRLVREDHNFKWNKRFMNKTTDFRNNNKVEKLVSNLPLNKAKLI